MGIDRGSQDGFAGEHVGIDLEGGIVSFEAGREKDVGLFEIALQILERARSEEVDLFLNTKLSGEFFVFGEVGWFATD